jgi:hypothetical protein
MTKYMKRSEESTITPITIQLTGFPSVEQAKQFLSAIIRPDLQAHFMNATMTLEAGVVTIAQEICCNADQTAFGVCTSIPILSCAPRWAQAVRPCTKANKLQNETAGDSLGFQQSHESNL